MLMVKCGSVVVPRKVGAIGVPARPTRSLPSPTFENQRHRADCNSRLVIDTPEPSEEFHCVAVDLSLVDLVVLLSSIALIDAKSIDPQNRRSRGMSKA